MLDAALRHPGRAVRLIDHEKDRYSALVAERLERVDRGTRVRDRSLHVRDDEKDDVRDVEHRERLFPELRRRVDDDVVVVLREHLHRARDVRRGHELRLLGTRRGQEDGNTARSFPEDLGHRRSHALAGRQVDDGARVGRHLQHVTDRAELHDAIHERDRMATPAEDRGQVHRDRRLPRAALRREAHDHPSLQAGVAFADGERGRELVRSARQDEDRVDPLVGLRIDRPLRDRDHDDARAR